MSLKKSTKVLVFFSAKKCRENPPNLEDWPVGYQKSSEKDPSPTWKDTAEDLSSLQTNSFMLPPPLSEALMWTLRLSSEAVAGSSMPVEWCWAERRLYKWTSTCTALSLMPSLPAGGSDTSCGPGTY